MHPEPPHDARRSSFAAINVTPTSLPSSPHSREPVDAAGCSNCCICASLLPTTTSTVPYLTRPHAPLLARCLTHDLSYRRRNKPAEEARRTFYTSLIHASFPACPDASHQTLTRDKDIIHHKHATANVSSSVRFLWAPSNQPTSHHPPAYSLPLLDAQIDHRVASFLIHRLLSSSCRDPDGGTTCTHLRYTI